MEKSTQVQPKVETITKEGFSEKMKNNKSLQIVNVLSSDQYNLGSIKGSIKIPLAELDKRLGELNKNEEIVTYCVGSECSASSKAAEKLVAQGFKAKAYEGGIKEWKEAGLSMEEVKT